MVDFSQKCGRCPHRGETPFGAAKIQIRGKNSGCFPLFAVNQNCSIYFESPERRLAGLASEETVRQGAGSRELRQCDWSSVKKPDHDCLGLLARGGGRDAR